MFFKKVLVYLIIWWGQSDNKNKPEGVGHIATQACGSEGTQAPIEKAGCNGMCLRPSIAEAEPGDFLRIVEGSVKDFY